MQFLEALRPVSAYNNGRRLQRLVCPWTLRVRSSSIPCPVTVDGTCLEHWKFPSTRRKNNKHQASEGKDGSRAVQILLPCALATAQWQWLQLPLHNAEDLTTTGLQIDTGYEYAVTYVVARNSGIGILSCYTVKFSQCQCFLRHGPLSMILVQCILLRSHRL